MTEPATADQDRQSRNPKNVQRHPDGHELLRQAQPCVAHYPAVLSVCTGQSHPHIFLVQAMLAALRRDFPEFADTPVTGQLDAQTAENIRHLQACSGLPETGELDKRTWNRLCRLYRAMYDRYHMPSQG